MTDNEFYEYIKGNPTITGIVTHMKTWWSNEGTDKELQDLFDLIIKLDNSGQWILCSERLPEEGMEVLVYLYNNPRSPYIAWIEGGKWFTEEFEIESEYEPTEWMELPEPYEVEE